MGMSTDELVAIIKDCGVNRVVLYAPFLSSHIRNAKTHPQVLDLLRTCRQIIHTGVPLNGDEEQWAYANGLPIMVRSLSICTKRNLTENSSPPTELRKLVNSIFS